MAFPTLLHLKNISLIPICSKNIDCHLTPKPVTPSWSPKRVQQNRKTVKKQNEPNTIPHFSSIFMLAFIHSFIHLYSMIIQMWNLSSGITINYEQFVINIYIYIYIYIDKYQLYTIPIQFQIGKPCHHGT